MTGRATAKPQFDAVVFDLLTALLDSWTLWNRVAGSDDAGFGWRTEYLKLTYDAGPYRSYEGIVREAASNAGVPTQAADRLIAVWGELKCWPEASEVLRVLAARVPLGIATNSSNRLAEVAVGATGEKFAAVVTAENAGFYKPRPEPYRMALAALGFAPERVLFVAGSAADVPGASSVGMPVYWHNRRGLPSVGAVSPTYVEQSLLPLLDLFQEPGLSNGAAYRENSG
jgi:2-haloalkanoic acid dehalogenase type II